MSKVYKRAQRSATSAGTLSGSVIKQSSETTLDAKRQGYAVVFSRGKYYKVDLADGTKKTITLAERREYESSKRQKKLLKAQSTPIPGSLEDYPDMYALALEIIGAPSEVKDWLSTRNVFLGGETPNFLLLTEEGRQRIFTYLSKIESGTYV